MTPHKQPRFGDTAFNCPLCDAYAKQSWARAAKIATTGSSMGTPFLVNGMSFATCDHCEMVSIWMNESIIFPTQSIAQLPNIDMPDEVRLDYEEARSILTQSPRGAAAILRLALQKLCGHLGETGKNINDDIKSLVAKGLPEKLQKALDSVRVIGNNAVHPGVIDLKDDIDLASKLFGLINVICDIMISQPKVIDEIYSSKVPESAKEAIRKRDGIS